MARERRNGWPEPEYATMGDRLRQARAARGLSLRRLAEVLGVSPSLISQVETGRAKPSVNTLYALATELGISLDTLLFMDTEPPSRQAGEEPPGRGLRGGAAARSRAASSVTAQHPARLGCRVGAPHERIDPERRLPPCDLRGGWRIQPGRRVPAALRPGMGVCPERRPDRRIGFDEFVLQPGDAISFDSATPHRLFNAGEVPARAVWFVLGRRSADVARR